jgi:hypothetical protein
MTKHTQLKHTPGPWIIHGKKIYSQAKKNDGGGNVCVAYPHGPSGEWRHIYKEHAANARLIAAAPELLEIAAEALNWWHDDNASLNKGEPKFIELAHKLDLVRDAANAKASKVEVYNAETD